MATCCPCAAPALFGQWGQFAVWAVGQLPPLPPWLRRPCLQCRFNHMAEAAYATGPALFGGPALTLFYFFRIFLFPVSARGPKEPKSSRKREAPKSKKRGPKKRGPKRFFALFQCFSVFSVSAYSVFQRGAPKSPEYVRPQDLKIEAPKSPEYVRPQDLKIEAPQSGASNGFFLPCFKQTARGHAQDPNSAGPQESKAPKSETLK